MKRITTAQLLILAEIHNSIADRGFPPTLAEIGEARHVKSWRNVIRGHVRALEAKGLIEQDHAVPRGLRITEKGTAALWENSINEETR